MQVTTTDCAAATLAGLLSYILYQKHRAKQNSLPLPPGPPCWPLVGSLPSIPKGAPLWDVFKQWGEKYGDVCYARFLNQDTIILNSYEDAVELLDRRSATYSSRPRLVMANEVIGWKFGLAMLPFGDRMRRTRRMLQEGMSTKAMTDLWPLQEREAIKFTKRLLDTPEQLNEHIRQASGAIVLKLAYGYNVESLDDPFIVLADTTVDMFSTVTTPGKFMVDIFPFLKHLPWTPFQAQIRAWQKLLIDFVDLPMQIVHDNMKKGGGEPCLVGRWLEREVLPKDKPREVAEYNESIIKWGAMSLYGGGSDTTVSAISGFFAIMTVHPLVQAMAQAEIAQVIEAVYKEVMRWNPIVPIGIPHRYDAKADDEFQGMRIPKGSTVFANVWKMLRDPKMYQDPALFNPERFMGPPESVERNPEDIVFGFGRRRCPGVNVAHSSVWLSIALTLAVYNITPVFGPDGKPGLPSLRSTSGTISHPETFRCTITPRSQKAVALIKEASTAGAV